MGVAEVALALFYVFLVFFNDYVMIIRILLLIIYSFIWVPS